MKMSFLQSVKEQSIYLTMGIPNISELWSNIKKYDKILTTFPQHHFFKKGSVFSEHVQFYFY